MDKFRLMTTMVKPDGSTMSIEDYSKLCCGGGYVEVYKNSIYQVIKKPSEGLVWLSIKRIDKEPIHDWRDLQEIKNMLVGEECEGVELFPAESRRVDTSNQYHIWVITDPTFRFPFGFNERLVTDADVAREVGAKQRPFKKE